MQQLRLDAEESAAKVEELQAKVKALEQDSLAKEQEIISLTHKNNVLEAEVDKLEAKVKELKATASEGEQHGTQNETLTRRLQLLEEEAEEADKTLRETNEKYVGTTNPPRHPVSLLTCLSPQVAADRYQGWTLRAKSSGPRTRARPVGVQVRGDVQEVLRSAEGAR